MEMDPQIKERYFGALEQLCARLEEDYYVLAAVLYGSLVRGEAWERSDIDLVIVLRDGQERESRHLQLVEDDIDISADVVTRNQFKRGLESALQGSFTHSIRSQYRLLFSKDETIVQWLKEPEKVNAHDQAYQLLSEVQGVPYLIDKATKWLTVKHDVNYAFMWVLYAVNTLAKVEVILSGSAPGREALDQAVRINPGFFQVNFTDLINGAVTVETVGTALEQVDNYLLTRVDRLFGALLTYLAQAGGPVNLSELDQHFKKKVPGVMLLTSLDWLTRHGIIQKLSSPLRLTHKSTVSVEEPAFYYDTEDISDWESQA